MQKDIKVVLALILNLLNKRNSCYICTKSLSLSENNKTIVSDLNVCFETGHIYSICGFNGSGKSTFINLLIGLYVDEYKGDILINNLSLQEIDSNQEGVIATFCKKGLRAVVR